MSQHFIKLISSFVFCETPYLVLYSSGSLEMLQGPEDVKFVTVEGIELSSFDLNNITASDSALSEIHLQFKLKSEGQVLILVKSMKTSLQVETESKVNVLSLLVLGEIKPVLCFHVSV